MVAADFANPVSTIGSYIRESWNTFVVVAREDDDAAMLNHALIQSRPRYGS